MNKERVLQELNIGMRKNKLSTSAAFGAAFALSSGTVYEIAAGQMEEVVVLSTIIILLLGATANNAIATGREVMSQRGRNE